MALAPFNPALLRTDQQPVNFGNMLSQGIKTGIGIRQQQQQAQQEALRTQAMREAMAMRQQQQARQMALQIAGAQQINDQAGTPNMGGQSIPQPPMQGNPAESYSLANLSSGTGINPQSLGSQLQGQGQQPGGISQDLMNQAGISPELAQALRNPETRQRAMSLLSGQPYHSYDIVGHVDQGDRIRYFIRMPNGDMVTKDVPKGINPDIMAKAQSMGDTYTRQLTPAEVQAQKDSVQQATENNKFWNATSQTAELARDVNMFIRNNKVELGSEGAIQRWLMSATTAFGLPLDVAEEMKEYDLIKYMQSRLTTLDQSMAKGTFSRGLSTSIQKLSTLPVSAVPGTLKSIIDKLQEARGRSISNNNNNILRFIKAGTISEDTGLSKMYSPSAFNRLVPGKGSRTWADEFNDAAVEFDNAYRNNDQAKMRQIIKAYKKIKVMAARSLWSNVPPTELQGVFVPFDLKFGIPIQGKNAGTFVTSRGHGYPQFMQ